jgi:hypothetical protein
MKYLVSQVEQWGDELDSLAPDPGSRKVGKRGAVLLIAKKLQAAVRRGLTASELRAALAKKGLEVHIDLLREALRAAGKPAATTPAGRRRKVTGNAPSEPGLQPRGLQEGEGRAAAAAAGVRTGVELPRDKASGPDETPEIDREVALESASEIEGNGTGLMAAAGPEVTRGVPATRTGSRTDFPSVHVQDMPRESDQVQPGRSAAPVEAPRRLVDPEPARGGPGGSSPAVRGGGGQGEPAARARHAAAGPSEAKPGAAPVPRGTFVPRRDSETI